MRGAPSFTIPMLLWLHLVAAVFIARNISAPPLLVVRPIGPSGCEVSDDTLRNAVELV